MINKKNLPLYLALAIPALMIIGIALAIYLPGIFKKPQYNFVYMSGQGVSDGMYGIDNYYVKNGHLVYEKREIKNNYYYRENTTDSHFYLYDVSKESSQEITFEQASAINLDPANQSQDGYKVSRGNGRGGDFIFGGGYSDYNSIYLQGHNRSKVLNLKLVGASSWNNFIFLGWVVK